MLRYKIDEISMANTILSSWYELIELNNMS